MGVGYADNDRQVVLKFIETTDVHGNFLSYDFINDRAYHGGLSKVESYVRRQRNLWGEDHCILLDCGDILEGQPCAYYANFIAKNEVHLAADIMNFMVISRSAMKFTINGFTIVVFLSLEPISSAQTAISLMPSLIRSSRRMEYGSLFLD